MCNVVLFKFKRNCCLTGLLIAHSVELCNSLIVCGGNLSASNDRQYLDSTNYAMDKYKDCEWEINTDVGYIIIFKLEDIRVEKEFNCTHNYVELSQRISNEKTVLAKFCSGQAKNKIYRSYQRKMLLRFHFDNPGVNNKFKASFVQGLLEILLSYLIIIYYYFIFFLFFFRHL